MPEADARTTPDAADVRVTPAQRIAAYGVHVFTACGVIFAFLAAAEISSSSPQPKRIFLYLAIQVLIDALDGPMARRWHVKTRAARIDGRTIDDIVDYLTYTFIPLLLVWRMGWVPAPGGFWIAPAIVASLFGFANTAAKDERGGFFLGFPSYWNIVAFYCGVWHHMAGPWPGAVVIVVLTILTVLPVRFIYPNLAPRPWKMPTMIGALSWLLLLAWMWMSYPTPPAWLMWASLIYPAFYIALSAWLDVKSRQISATAGTSASD
ncbi:MAG: phosphatidylcholine synthase [Phycisphaerales bacterium]|nr:phosphatidylcholine synthase [Phycisphaerales bacterium]